MLLAKKYFKNNKELLEQIKYHDLDKLYMYLFFDKKSVSRIHRELSSHHENDLEKTYIDFVEMVLDWESARYTKLDKPLNAYDTLYKFYPEMEEFILPILKEMGIDSSNTPMEEDILKYAQEINDITDKELENELISNVKLLLKNK